MIDKIVQQVIARLQLRQQQVYRLTATELATGIPETIYSHYATLALCQPDLALLQKLAETDGTHPLVASVLQAWSYGVTLQISVLEPLIALLPLALSQYPVSLRDQNGLAIIVHRRQLLTYRDIRQLNPCWLIICQRCLLTPLAQETLDQQKIKLVRSALC